MRYRYWDDILSDHPSPSGADMRSASSDGLMLISADDRQVIAYYVVLNAFLRGLLSLRRREGCAARAGQVPAFDLFSLWNECNKQLVSRLGSPHVVITHQNIVQLLGATLEYHSWHSWTFWGIYCWRILLSSLRWSILVQLVIALLVLSLLLYWQ